VEGLEKLTVGQTGSLGPVLHRHPVQGLDCTVRAGTLQPTVGLGSLFVSGESSSGASRGY
jgi:hypothetical protein